MTKKAITQVEEKLPQQLSDNQLHLINKPTPKEFVDRVTKPGGTFDYVKVGYVKAKLNQIFGNLGWDFEVEVVDKLSGKNFVTVKGKLTVKDHLGHTVTKQDFGSASIKKFKDGSGLMNPGNDAKAASSDALKKCASALGIAFDIYHPTVYSTVERMKQQIGQGAYTLPEINKNKEEVTYEEVQEEFPEDTTAKNVDEAIQRAKNRGNM